MSSLVLTLNVQQAAKLKTMRDRLRTLMQRGDLIGASLCADAILDLLGLRTFRLEDHS